MSVTATLHHLDCRRAQWTRTDQGFLGRHLSTTTRLVRMPFGNAARDPFCPTLVVNPSLEQVTLTLEEHGRYRATTVASYRPLGLTSPRHGLARSTTPLVTSWVTDGALIVRCGDMYWHFSLTGRDDPLGAEIRDREEVVLAISTALNPAEMENPEPLKRVLRADDLAAIVVPLNTTDPAPDLTGHTIIVNSDFAHADEASDLDWIPDEAHYPGPSYDPATGRFATGTGMDGPLYWQLNTPGIGVENGLIAGPPDIGKTNNLLVLAVEALSSQIFVYCLADPRDRNGIVDILGRAAHDVARTPEETLQLFGKVVAMIDYRAADPDRYRDPTGDFPGVLLLLDDAHEVLRDPAAAGLAEKIVLSGPPVGIGMIVSTPSLELADFGGRRELVLALAKTNCLTYSLDHLEQMKKLRASL